MTTVASPAPPRAGGKPLPGETKRWGDLYGGRSAVDREFGRLQHECGLTRLRVRGLAKVALFGHLVMLARLASALARAYAVPLALSVFPAGPARGLD